MSIRKKHHTSKSKWKRLFYSLLAFNFVFFLTLVALIFWPVSDADYSSYQEREPDESSEFIVRTTKQNLNELINAYISQLLGDTRHQYSIELEEDVHLLGELPVFSSTVPLSVHFEPIVQDNGDIILQQKSISVGLLELPNKKIMEYMGRYLPMPEWVTVNPSDEEIYVALSEMDIKSNFEVGVEYIDLEANNIAFKIRVPYRTLGIEYREQ
ncbi:YpmS family protein [Virgibacillus sp. C22-A2]|uniref:YpmS family protein n=1 Tax=Virgibacillus tibetensis TaxID=3042313 RepID=A0ABU6KH35_9BACI|nr:YpmS family protein [Virgibacillus sp. C22-A2]